MNRRLLIVIGVLVGIAGITWAAYAWVHAQSHVSTDDAYVSDVFVVPSERGRGVGGRLMAAIMTHPELQGLRRWTLFTRDAHALYRRFGFGDARYPDRLMEVLTDPYMPAP